MGFITVEDLFAEKYSQLKLQLVSGNNGLKNKITNPRIQKPGLALSGYLKQVHAERVQILGQTEFKYLQTLPEEKAEKRIAALCSLPLSCIIISTGQLPPPSLVNCTETHRIPLIRTELPSSILINRISSYLEERLAPEEHLHGVLVAVYDIGVLIMGPSGIGKSECALELVARGHQLISDDLVRVKLRSSEVIIGGSPDITRHYIEIRGIGVLNIKDLFGVAAVRGKKQVEMVIRLRPWDSLGGGCERLGLDEQREAILGVELPKIEIPVAPGRNLAIIIEVAARNQLLRQKGLNSASLLNDKLNQQLLAHKISAAKS